MKNLVNLVDTSEGRRVEVVIGECCQDCFPWQAENAWRPFCLSVEAAMNLAHALIAELHNHGIHVIDAPQGGAREHGRTADAPDAPHVRNVYRKPEGMSTRAYLLAYRQGLVVRANGSINFLEMQAFIQSRAFVGLRGAGKKVVSEWREWLAAQDVAGE